MNWYYVIIFHLIAENHFGNSSKCLKKEKEKIYSLTTQESMPYIELWSQFSYLINIKFIYDEFQNFQIIMKTIYIRSYIKFSGIYSKQIIFMNTKIKIKLLKTSLYVNILKVILYNKIHL